MSFSQITSVDLVVNQITTIVTQYTPSSPAGIHALGDIAPTETIIRTSSNVGLNRINTTPIWSNSVQVYNTQYTLGNNVFNYDADRSLTGNDARSVISGAGSYGTQTFTYNNQNLGGVVATTPVLDRGASLGGLVADNRTAIDAKSANLISALNDNNYYTTQYFNSGLNIPYGDITANVSAYSAQTYTVPGTYSWTVPAGVYSITLGAVGAGGGGVQKTGGGAGGSGGNVAYYNSYTVTPGDTYIIVVGSGGAPGAVFGTTGGSTHITRSTSNVAIIVAGGGAGGNSLYWQTDDISVRALDAAGIIARVTAVDPNARTIAYNISSGSLPIGAVLNTANGAITWTKQNLSSTTEYAPFTVSATVSLPTQVISKRYAIQITTTP